MCVITNERRAAKYVLFHINWL